MEDDVMNPCPRGKIKELRRFGAVDGDDYYTPDIIDHMIAAVLRVYPDRRCDVGWMVEKTAAVIAHGEGKVKPGLIRERVAKTIDEKRRSVLLAAGGLAPDLRIGDRSIGFYDRKTGEWSKPDT